MSLPTRLSSRALRLIALAAVVFAASCGGGGGSSSTSTGSGGSSSGSGSGSGGTTTTDGHTLIQQAALNQRAGVLAKALGRSQRLLVGLGSIDKSPIQTQQIAPDIY